VNELIPLILLFLFGGFAVVTAALKARSRVTSPVAVVFTLLEAVSGVALMVVAFPGSENLAAASRMGMVAGVMVALSSTVHLVQVRARSRANEESEGHRLHLAVKYGVGRGKVYGEPVSDIDVDTKGDVQGDPGAGGV
jgi:hypothetical protein